MNTEDIKIFLPKYLSPSSEDKLLKDLEQFPENLSDNFYTKNLEKEFIYQGDGIDGMLFISMPNSKTREGKALIISNTCDMHKDNNRISKKQILYAPIIVLDKYREIINKLK